MTIESDDLAALRETTSKALLGLLWLHVPIALAIGMMRDNGWLAPTALMAAMAIAATASWASSGNGLSTRLTFAIALMGGVSVFAYQLAGHPWQIDMHMYFFAALACLVAYCDYRPILAGTVAVALHHLALNFLLPAAIYPGGADLGRVVLHAVILLMEAGVLMLAVVQTVASVRGDGRRRPPRPRLRMPQKPAPIASAWKSKARPSRIATRRGVNSRPDSSARSEASSRRSRLPQRKCRACHRP